MDFKKYRLDVNKSIDINLRVTENLRFSVEQVDKQWYVYDGNKRVHASYKEESWAQEMARHLNNQYEDVVKLINNITETELSSLSEELAYVT